MKYSNKNILDYWCHNTIIDCSNHKIVELDEYEIIDINNQDEIIDINNQDTNDKVINNQDENININNQDTNDNVINDTVIDHQDEIIYINNQDENICNTSNKDYNLEKLNNNIIINNIIHTKYKYHDIKTKYNKRHDIDSVKRYDKSKSEQHNFRTKDVIRGNTKLSTTEPFNKHSRTRRKNENVRNDSFKETNKYKEPNKHTFVQERINTDYNKSTMFIMREGCDLSNR